MKRSHIFWNVMILIIEFIIGVILFGVGDNFVTYLLLVFGCLHSLFLIGEIDRGFNINREHFSLIFLFVSFLGIFFLILIGIVFIFMKIGKKISNPFNPLVELFYRFNNWIDGK